MMGIATSPVHLVEQLCRFLLRLLNLRANTDTYTPTCMHSSLVICIHLVWCFRRKFTGTAPANQTNVDINLPSGAGK
jgi:hypothetical protein